MKYKIGDVLIDNDGVEATVIEVIDNDIDHYYTVKSKSGHVTYWGINRLDNATDVTLKNNTKIDNLEKETNELIDKLSNSMIRQWYVDPAETTPTSNNIIKICECGAEKCGSPGHSSWCPKFNKEGK